MADEFPTQRRGDLSALFDPFLHAIFPDRGKAVTRRKLRGRRWVSLGYRKKDYFAGGAARGDASGGYSPLQCIHPLLKCFVSDKHL